MKKMKSLAEFKNENVLTGSTLEIIQGGKSGPGTEYFVGECTDVLPGGDCRNIGYNDDHSPSSYIGPIMPIGTC